LFEWRPDIAERVSPVQPGIGYLPHALLVDLGSHETISKLTQIVRPAGMWLLFSCRLEAEMFNRLAQLVVVALALMVGSHAKAGQLTYGTYFEDTENVQCSITSACRLNFLQFPSYNLVMINNLNCSILSTAELGQFTLEIAATSGGAEIAGGAFYRWGCQIRRPSTPPFTIIFSKMLNT
jgi:hypothetical protein